VPDAPPEHRHQPNASRGFWRSIWGQPSRPPRSGRWSHDGERKLARDTLEVRAVVCNMRGRLLLPQHRGGDPEIVDSASLEPIAEPRVDVGEPVGHRMSRREHDVLGRSESPAHAKYIASRTCSKGGRPLGVNASEGPGLESRTGTRFEFIIRGRTLTCPQAARHPRKRAHVSWLPFRPRTLAVDYWLSGYGIARAEARHCPRGILDRLAPHRHRCAGLWRRNRRNSDDGSAEASLKLC